MRALTLLAIVTVAGTVSARDERILPLFSVVQFKTDECQATSSESGGDYSGLMGTCLSSTECSDRGGSQKGNCAAGFGVCCVKTLYACGGTVTHNNTYIGNVGYPTVLAAGANTCAYTVTRLGDICQVRLDFQDVNLVIGTNGITTAAGAGGALAATGGSGNDPPNVSGELSGQHMYVEVNGVDPTITLTTIAGAANINQKWNIRVQQIPCNDAWKAPRDCTQWFTASTGTVRSYNARSTTKKELGGQDMTICIRQNEGMCGAVFTAESFSVGIAIAVIANGNPALGCAATAWGIAIDANGNGAVTIPGAGTFCGTNFALSQEISTAIANVMQTVSAPVTVKNGPITLHHFTGDAGSSTNTGFELNYTQI